jgi:carbon monoxide dehydrogenase subunit G
MQLEQSFEVDAPLDRVWAALVDVERVAPCLPGAAVTGRNDDGSYNGTFTIKIGPTTASYTGKLEMREIDESSHSATMHAQGSDRRGQGGATATINSRLSSADGRTRVEVMTDYHITGRLARFGRGGMIEDISERLLRDFASRLQASLTYSEGSEAPGPAAPEPAAVAEEPTAPHALVVEEGGESEQPTTETAAVGFDEPPAVGAGESASVGAGESASVGAGESASVGAGESASVGAGEPAAPEPPPTEVAAPSGEGATPAPEPEAPPPPPPHAEPPPPPPPPPPPESEPPPPLDGMALVGSVLVDRVKRNPAPVIAVVGGLVLLRIVLRRRGQP